MAGAIFAVFVSIGLPLISFLYALYKKRWLPFGLGVLAFVVSQMLLRIPILQYLGSKSVAYNMFKVTQPVLFAILIGLSAGIFEELTRFLAMRFFMKQRDWQSGLLFGAGHGGIEAVLFVGISVVPLLFSPTGIANGDSLFIGGIERFFAIGLHIGLTFLVLQGVIHKRFLYVIIAIVIHGAVDALVGILPIYVPKEYVLITLEVTLAITAIALFAYSLWIKRKGVLK